MKNKLSDKRKASMARYMTSDKGLAAKKRYRDSYEGTKTILSYQKDYREDIKDEQISFRIKHACHSHIMTEETRNLFWYEKARAKAVKVRRKVFKGNTLLKQYYP